MDGLAGAHENLDVGVVESLVGVYFGNEDWPTR